MNQATASKFQLHQRRRLLWLGFGLLFGLTKLYDFAIIGKLSALLSGVGFLLMGLTFLLAPMSSNRPFAASGNEEGAIGPRWLHRAMAIVSVLAIGISMILRIGYGL